MFAKIGLTFYQNDRDQFRCQMGVPCAWRDPGRWTLALSFGQGGWGQRVILWSGGTEVLFWKNKINFHQVPAKQRRTELIFSGRRLRRVHCPHWEMLFEKERLCPFPALCFVSCNQWSASECDLRYRTWRVMTSLLPEGYKVFAG